MRSIDMTTTARIRQSALELFAADGVAGTSVRSIATEADVSPALILHHFGSKDGLRRAVDEFVLNFITEVLDEFSQAGSSEGGVAAFSRVAEQPAVLTYASRAIISGDAAGDALFDQVAKIGTSNFTQMHDAGLVRDLEDPEMVSLFLLAADLAVMLLRSHIQRQIGFDPMSPEGIERWTRAEFEVVGQGIFKRNSSSEQDSTAEQDSQ